MPLNSLELFPQSSLISQYFHECGSTGNPADLICSILRFYLTILSSTDVKSEGKNQWKLLETQTINTGSVGFQVSFGEPVLVDGAVFILVCTRKVEYLLVDFTENSCFRISCYRKTLVYFWSLRHHSKWRMSLGKIFSFSSGHSCNILVSHLFMLWWQKEPWTPVLLWL